MPGEGARRAQDRLSYLRNNWNEPQRLTPKHKAILRTIKSLEQGYDGTIARCWFCHELAKSDRDMHLHHKNHIINDNRLENIEVAHQKCNTDENARWAAHERWKARSMQVPRVSDQHGRGGEQTAASGADSRIPTGAGEQGDEGKETEKRNTPNQGKPTERTITDDAKNWSSKEGIKHDTQRYAWNKWITDLEVGPFKGVNTRIGRSALAKMAPWGLGRYLGLDGVLGSSNTYRRFVDEDVQGNVLGIDEDEFGKAVVFLLYEPKTERRQSK